MLNRLVCRAILAKTNTIMSEDINRRDMGQGCQPNRGSTVVRKHHKGPPKRTNTAMKSHSVHRCSHGVLPYTIMDVTPPVIGRGKDPRIIHKCVIAACQVSRTTYQFRHGIFELLQDSSRRLTRCHPFGICCKWFDSAI